STIRRSRRWYQTRCGIRWTSGCATVAIDERQTGVRDGKVEIPRAYVPFAARNFRAGVRSSSAARSKASGVRPSITIRISFLATALIACERAQTCVPLGLAAARAGGERGQRERFQVAEKRDECESRDAEACEADQDSGARRGAAPAQGPAGERSTAEPAEQASDRTADGVVPVVERETDRGSYRRADQDRDERARPASRQPSGCGKRGTRADAGSDADAIPLPHAVQSSAGVRLENRSACPREITGEGPFSLRSPAVTMGCRAPLRA